MANSQYKSLLFFFKILQVEYQGRTHIFSHFENMGGQGGDLHLHWYPYLLK
jgi:hypothetical protein